MADEVVSHAFSHGFHPRPSELFGLDKRDVDRQAGVVDVRRAYANGRLKQHEDAAEHSDGAAAGEGA